MSEEELIFSESVEICAVDPVSISFEFISETGGAEVCYSNQMNPEMNPGLRQ